jgi:Tol biopolymer transport system component
MQLAAIGEDECPGLAFSPDGNYVYFVRRNPRQPGGDLYRVPFLGGNPVKMISEVSGPPAISPDGRRVAFVRSTLATHGRDSVVAAYLDGSGERVLASYKAPGIHLNRISWTADGKSLVYPLQSGLMAIPAEGGTALRIPGAEWAEIDDVRPLPMTNELIVLGWAPGSTSAQIFDMSLNGGEPRQITHDLSNYSELRVSADGKTLLALQDLVLSGIQIFTPDHGTESLSLRDDSQNLDGYSGMAWSPEGKIVYISKSDRRWDVMEADGDGSQTRRLANGELPTPYTDPAVSPRGDFIAVTQWKRNDESNIWRMDRNGAA